MMYRIICSAIGYDGGRSGISEYINHTVINLSQDHLVHIVILKSDYEVFPHKNKVNISFTICSDYLSLPLINMVWHLYFLRIKVDLKRFDFLFLPAANRRLVSSCPIPVIATFHDLSQFHIEGKYDFLRMFYIRHIVPHYLKSCNKVLSISASTRYDLVHYYHLDPKCIEINHNGCDTSAFSPKVKGLSPEDILKCGKKYILYVARIEHPGKNHLNLIKAYERLPEKIKAEYSLVCAGSDWNGSEEVHRYRRQSLDKERILMPGYVPSSRLPALYRGASLYVFPSYFEGFGLPLLEAMSCGIPVVCANSSSLPEIGGDAVLTFDPSDPEDIMHCISRVIVDNFLCKELVKRGHKRVRSFTWEEHTRHIIDSFEKAANDRRRPEIFGVHFDNVAMSEALGFIDSAVSQHQKKLLNFINADCLNKCHFDKEYSEILNHSDGVFPDGSGVHLACRLFDIELKGNVNGTDMLPLLCQQAVEKDFSLYFLGGEEGVAQRMKTNLEKEFPGLRIVGVHHGYFNRQQESQPVIDQINNSQADVLLTALGAPLQEKWLAEHFKKIDCSVMMGVGGLFDFYSGDKKRAPSLLRKTGCEWCFRLYLEPTRLARRYLLGNPVFVIRLLIWKYRLWRAYKKRLRKVESEYLKRGGNQYG